MGGGYIDLIDLFWPIGSYYETSDSNFNPNNSWGGTWERETDGVVLVSEGIYYPGSSGGNATLQQIGDTFGSTTDSITAFDIPAHTHTYYRSNTTSGAASGNTGSTTLTINQIPKHTHNLKYRFLFWDGGSNYQIGKADPSWSGEIQYNAIGTKWYITAETGGSQGHTHTLNNHKHSISTYSTNTGSAGSSNIPAKTIDIVQPSKVVVRWHRIA